MVSWLMFVRARGRVRFLDVIAVCGDARIDITGVSVFFPLYHGSSRSLKKTVLAAASGRLGKDMQSARRRAGAARHLVLVEQRRPAGPDRHERRGQDDAVAHACRDL